MPGTLEVGQCGLIEEAMALIEFFLSEDRFDLGDDADARGFAPELFIVRDRFDRLVLAAKATGHPVAGCQPVASDHEAEQVTRQAFELYGEASYEAGWDNFSTAEGLRLRARVLEGRLVDRSWRSHAVEAIRNATV